MNSKHSQAPVLPPDVLADTQAVMEHLTTGTPLDPEIARRIRARAERITEAIRQTPEAFSTLASRPSVLFVTVRTTETGSRFFRGLQDRGRGLGGVAPAWLLGGEPGALATGESTPVANAPRLARPAPEAGSCSPHKSPRPFILEGSGPPLGPPILQPQRASMNLPQPSGPDPKLNPNPTALPGGPAADRPGRDSRGRFAPGNKGGPGNPFAAGPRRCARPCWMPSAPRTCKRSSAG